MTFPKTCPFTRQLMRFVLWRQCTGLGKQCNNLFQQSLITTTLQTLLVRTLELIGKKYFVHHSSNFAINSATLSTFVTLPFRTSSTARDNVPLPTVRVLAMVTPFKLLKILRNPGNKLLSSIFNTICVIVPTFNTIVLAKISYLCETSSKGYHKKSKSVLSSCRF